ncbi:MAG: LytR/AlgR family response regulator transcription factor [Aureispira sp.]
MSTLLLNLNQQTDTIQRLVIKTTESIHIININEIIFCQSDKGYTTFQLVENRTIISSKILADYESVLPKKSFMRIHQSYLVNLHHVIRYDKKDKNALVTLENHKLPVALRRKEQLMKFLNNIVH